MQLTVLTVREYTATRLLGIMHQWREHRWVFDVKTSNFLFMDLKASWGPPYSLIFQICIWDAAKRGNVYAKCQSSDAC